jgi:hypothetical protein
VKLCGGNVCLSDLRSWVGIRPEAQIRPHETSVYPTTNYRPTARFCDLRSADCYARE